MGSLTYYPYGHPEDELRIAVDLMKKGRVRVAPLITAKIPLDDIDKGFQSLLNGEELGVVVQP
jgi:Zn-dependent alcohol dehydrogenase